MSKAGERPLILVTCDDGIDSPGLGAAATALQPLGDILISATCEQQTGMSRSLPTSNDGAIYAVDYQLGGQSVPAYAIHGSPAQAVLYALVELAASRPALCVSGINFGENVGSGVTVSGTIGAALEAADAGIPSLAVSLETEKQYHYNHSQEVDLTAAIHFTRFFAHRMLAHPLPRDVDILKIEVPADATAATPWRITRQSRRGYYAAVASGRTSLQERRRLDYRIGFDPASLEPDSDIRATIIDRVVSVTPLSIDLTSRVTLDELDAMLRRMNP